MKKVFLLASDPLMLKAWEVRLKDSSWELYSLENTEDYSFRLVEFSPDLVVMSAEMATEAILNISQIPIAILSDEAIMGRVILKKPLNINELDKLLDELFTQFS